MMIGRILHSLTGRLLLASLLALPLVLSIAGWSLERAHRLALDANIAERLQLQVLTLLSQIDFADADVQPFNPVEQRLLQPNSGLYAMITDARGDVLWLSPSAVLLQKPIETLDANLPGLKSGQTVTAAAEDLVRHAYQIVWETDDGTAIPLRFLVAESAAPRSAELATYRNNLIWSLGATMFLLLLLQWLVLRWGLKPLRHLTDSVRQIEAGEHASLVGRWPEEVSGLANNLQQLLDGEVARRERLRNTLADLAHSLKTPLAVLRTADPKTTEYEQVRTEQLERMEQVIQWQLQRATGPAGKPLTRVPIAPVVERLKRTLEKVYADRGIKLVSNCDAEATFRGDERDLMELMGNLMDNACKYGKASVNVSVLKNDGSVVIHIDDDGDGVSPDLRDALLTRGARMDERQSGQGIGLYLVAEIVNAHGGNLTFDQSAMGGANVTVSFPQ